MARKQVLVQLDDELVAALDRRSGALGVSRSELIRRAIASHLRDLEWADADRKSLEAYARLPEEPGELTGLDQLAGEVLGANDRDET